MPHTAVRDMPPVALVQIEFHMPPDARKATLGPHTINVSSYVDLPPGPATARIASSTWLKVHTSSSAHGFVASKEGTGPL